MSCVPGIAGTCGTPLNRNRGEQSGRSFALSIGPGTVGAADCVTDTFRPRMPSGDNPATLGVHPRPSAGPGGHARPRIRSHYANSLRPHVGSLPTQHRLLSELSCGRWEPNLTREYRTASPLSDASVKNELAAASPQAGGSVLEAVKRAPNFTPTAPPPSPQTPGS